MPTTTIPALRHVRSLAPYNANTFAEQNAALVGESRRLRGFDYFNFVANTSLTIEPGVFISVGLALNPAEPNRIAGIIAETTSNAVIDATGFGANDDFYVYAIVNTPSEGTAVNFVLASSPAPVGQYAPIMRKIAGEYILEDGLGADTLEQSLLRARTDSGADQFYLIPNVNPTPRTVTITSATLPDGSVFAGDPAFGGSPAFSVGASNYIWYRFSLGTLENNTTGFLADADTLPLWVLDLDGSGNVTGKTDSRCWFGGGGGAGDASSIFERLKEPLQHGVMGDAQISTLPDLSLPHVDIGNSTGTFVGPASYELYPGDVLQSGFTVAHSQAPDPVNQVVVVVLTDRIVLPAEIQIEVSRNITGGTTLPPINFESMSNFANHVFTTPPVGSDDNILNIKITNVGALPFEVQGWGLYFNQVGGTLGLITEGPGIYTGSTGLVVGNQKPNWSWIHPLPGVTVEFTWSALLNRLSWDNSFQFEYAVDGTYQTNTVLVGSSPLNGVLAGDYIYADLNRAGGNVVLQRQAGPPVPTKDRVIFARREGSDLWLQDGTYIPASYTVMYPPKGLSEAMYNAALAANAPTFGNPFATIADLASVDGKLKSVAKYTGQAITSGSGEVSHTYANAVVAPAGSSSFRIVSGIYDSSVAGDVGSITTEGKLLAGSTICSVETSAVLHGYTGTVGGGEFLIGNYTTAYLYVTVTTTTVTLRLRNATPASTADAQSMLSFY